MKTLLIDCSFLCHRAIHTMGHLSAGNHRTGVIFGFLKQIQSISNDWDSNKLIFCWDSKKSKRKVLFPGYKDRVSKLTEAEKEEREIQYAQFDQLREWVIPTMGFSNSFHQSGYEADDIMAAIALNYDRDFLMVTADEDMFQILDMTDMWSPTKPEVVHTYKSFENKWGIFPEQWADVKALAGCKSDTVPGISGVGEKKAAAWLRKEMNPKTETYNKIKNNAAEMYLRNIPLVKLPMEGTKIPKLRRDKFSPKGFHKVCDRYLFTHLEPSTDDFLIKRIMV
jgi:DNA polymerase-1